MTFNSENILNSKYLFYIGIYQTKTQIEIIATQIGPDTDNST